MHTETFDLVPFVTSLPGCHLQSGLYITATPIGHLADISLRALATLAQADLIACEDTRVTSKLLSAYGIRRPLIAYHEHNRHVAGKEILTAIKEEKKSVALVSDAGTPMISDPGNDLIKQCVSAGVYVSAIPGACAAITALTLSGLNTENFVFIGFLSSKQTARKRQLSNYQNYAETLVLYESPHRIKALLRDIFEVLPDRQLVVAKELTKKFETIWRGNAESILGEYETISPKGEYVVLIEGAEQKSSEVTDAMIQDMLQTHSAKDAAQWLSATYGVSKKEVYQRLLKFKT